MPDTSVLQTEDPFAQTQFAEAQLAQTRLAHIESEVAKEVEAELDRAITCSNVGASGPQGIVIKQRSFITSVGQRCVTMNL